MFITILKPKLVDGVPTISFPFPSVDIDWPLFAPAHDTGLYVMGLFEGEDKANGAHAQAVSTWTTPKDVVAAISKEAGREVRFNPLPAETYMGFFEDKTLGAELTETMRLAGEYNYYGKGQKEKQAEFDQWLLPGAEKMGFERWVKENGPWKFE